MNEALMFLLYYLSGLATICIIIISFKRSAYGVLLASTLLWYLIGVCIYPILELFFLVDRGVDAISFILYNDPPGLMAAAHVFFISVGMLIGYFGCSRKSGIKYFLDKIFNRFRFSTINPIKLWRISIIFGLLIFALYFFLVGFDTALVNAAAARSGVFDEFENENVDQYLFLKTLAGIGGVSVFVLVFALHDRDRIFIFLFLVFIALGYVNSISRSLILYSLIVPLIVFARLRRFSPIWLILGILLLPLGYYVLLYGKPFGYFMSAYISGQNYVLEAYQGDAGFLNAVFRNLDFQWYSIQAGINHFFETGLPLIPHDVPLATLFGIIPSRILGFFGVDFLYYGNADVRLSCVNTEMFGLPGCTIPPSLYGYSAYFLPLAGGLLIGFVMLRVYATIEQMWIIRERNDISMLWVPYFWFSFFSSLFSLIPTAIPVAEIQLIWVFALSKVLIKKERLP